MFGQGEYENTKAAQVLARCRADSSFGRTSTVLIPGVFTVVGCTGVEATTRSQSAAATTQSQSDVGLGTRGRDVVGGGDDRNGGGMGMRAGRVPRAAGDDAVSRRDLGIGGSRDYPSAVHTAHSKCGHTLFIHGTLLLSAAHQGQVRHTIYDTTWFGNGRDQRNEFAKSEPGSQAGLSTMLDFKHKSGLAKEFKKYSINTKNDAGMGGRRGRETEGDGGTDATVRVLEEAKIDVHAVASSTEIVLRELESVRGIVRWKGTKGIKKRQVEISVIPEVRGLSAGGRWNPNTIGSNKVSWPPGPYMLGAAI
ncbi:hypothetical protein FB451DRAFT_1491223 [Mycena latifolia]|nr:hypothetical protein FB451DRAFT_1491223 [Mycena latifolia]